MTTTTPDISERRAQAEFGAYRRRQKLAVAGALCLQVLDRPHVAPDVATMARDTLAAMPELYDVARYRVSDFRRWWSKWTHETCPAIRAALATEATR
jgi:hypothetical protein